MSRLIAQLPSTSPTARSAEPTMADELIPTISSGSDVTEAMRISPTQALPHPLSSPIRSPYRDRRPPATKIAAAQATNAMSATSSDTSDHRALGCP